MIVQWSQAAGIGSPDTHGLCQSWRHIIYGYRCGNLFRHNIASHKEERETDIGFAANGLLMGVFIH